MKGHQKIVALLGASAAAPSFWTRIDARRALKPEGSRFGAIRTWPHFDSNMVSASIMTGFFPVSIETGYRPCRYPGAIAPVFALAYLLGIKLMPHDLVFFRPDKETAYQHIDALFKGVVDWELIETHWKDLLRVVLSIKAGKISSSMLLRKLGNYGRKNWLYQAFRELGRVVRTAFLLRYISDLELPDQPLMSRAISSALATTSLMPRRCPEPIDPSLPI